jgi:hypothetical protein
MSEQNRYLNAEESRQVREFVDQHNTNPPADADSILDDLDRSILKSEGLSTIETVNSLLTARALDAQQRGQGSSISPSVQNAIQNDDAMADLDNLIFQEIRDRAPLAEDGGEAHMNATYNEIAEAEKKVKRQQGRAAQEMAETARRFMGFGYKTVSADQFYRGRKR